MTHRKQSHEELASPSTSFTITQSALGSPLQFEPALGSKELDNLINNYISGPATPQQKRAQVVLEFLNSIDALSYTHPVSIRYQVPQIMTPQTMPRHSSISSIAASSTRESFNCGTIKKETLNTSKSLPSLKRSRQESTSFNSSSAKRLPGFSIMTKDGIDITDLASRGPKTKEQRDHAALMRKLKACAACKKSKQRCDPSHHRPALSSLSTSSSAAPSNRSARFSCFSSAGASWASISPQSSLGESFSQTPLQGFVDHTTSQMGHNFPPLLTPRPSLSPPESMLPEAILTDSDLFAFPTQSINLEVCQWADMELDSWNSDVTAFPPADFNNAWNSQEDIFAPSYGYVAPIASQDVRCGEQDLLRSSAQVIPHANNGQNHDRNPRQPRQLNHSNVHSADFDIDQWLLPSLSREEPRVVPVGHHANLHGDMFRDYQSQQAILDSVRTRDQDYVLFPESPQFDWGLESHQISRDIGNKYSNAESGILKKRRLDAPTDKQDLTKSPCQVISDDALPVVQSAERLRKNLSYLPSPSASDGSEDNGSNCVFDATISGANDRVNYEEEFFSQNSNSTQSLSEHFNQRLMGVVQRSHDVPASSHDLIDGHHSLRPTTAMGSPYLLDQGHVAQFERPRRTVSELPIPDVQNPARNHINDQQAQQTLRKQTLPSLVENRDDWDLIWKEHDLRQTGLLAGIDTDDHAVQMCFSSHDVTRVDTINYNTSSSFVAEAGRPSVRSTISSDIPEEDGIRKYFRETLIWQRLEPSQVNSQRKDTSLKEALQSDNAQREPLLPADMQYSDEVLRIVQNLTPMRSQSMVRSERMTTILTLCVFMAISVLSTMSIMASNNPMGILKSEASLEQAIFYISNTSNYSFANSHGDGSSISLEHNYGPQCRVDSGPGFTHTTSGLDVVPFTMEHANYMESNRGVDSRADMTDMEMTSNDDEATYKSFSGHLTGYPSSSQGLFSLSMAPATSITPSTTKLATTWATHLPARSTANPVDAYSTVVSPTEQKSSVQLPSPSKLLQFLKRPWSWRFNPGHLGMRITSLTIL